MPPRFRLGPTAFGGVRPAALAFVAMLAWTAPATAASGDRWTLVEHRRVPIEYYQGLTHTGSGFFFVGVFRGGYLTDARLRRVKRSPNLIPSSVARIGFNHVGDPTFDAAGARLLAPLECYYPTRARPNTCGFGGFGVVDPQTLAWRYWVRLDGADVPKAMWAEVSPDGELVWTSSGKDLVAYRSSDVSEEHAATSATSPAIRPVRRLRGAVPPSGANGAAFSGAKLLLAGHTAKAGPSSGGVPQIWAVDLKTGKRTLQVRLPGTRAEVEGIDVAGSGPGMLRWLLTPGILPRPTYGSGHSELLTFVPIGYRVAASASLDGPQLRVHTSLRYASVTRVLAGATVRVGGRVAHTNAAGDATVMLSAAPRATLEVTVAKGGLRGLTLTVRPRRARG